MDYKNAGVDIEAGYRSVELMKKHVKETMRPEVLGGLGGFAGAFDLSGIKKMEEPILLSGTDGCGTKVKLASFWISMIPSALTQSPCVSMILPAQAESRYFSWIISHVGRITPRRLLRL